MKRAVLLLLFALAQLSGAAGPLYISVSEGAVNPRYRFGAPEYLEVKLPPGFHGPFYGDVFYYTSGTLTWLGASTYDNGGLLHAAEGVAGVQYFTPFPSEPAPELERTHYYLLVGLGLLIFRIFQASFRT
ncbi:MAG: hypothetical protein AAGI48_15110 [Verrucomicrobiota bacterium]